jgi:hypothetical protein
VVRHVISRAEQLEELVEGEPLVPPDGSGIGQWAEDVAGLRCVARGRAADDQVERTVTDLSLVTVCG